MRTIKLVTVVALTLACVAAQGQNTFFPTKAGMILLYAHQDDKGKVDSYTRHTFKNVEGSGSNLTISYVVEAFDKNMKPQGSEIPCTVVIKDDVVILDMNEMFVDQQKVSDIKVEITGAPMELPGNLQPGQSLKDANMTMTMEMGIIKMRTDIKVTDIKCEAIEDVTVQAGTFTCHKVTQTVTTTVMRRDLVGTTVTWYAPNIGTVKSETYNNKNKLTGRMELASLEN